VLGHGANGESILWTLATCSRKTVRLKLVEFQIDGRNGVKKVAGDIDADCIIPVRATRGTLADILVLFKGKLVLWTGHQALFPCKIKEGGLFDIGSNILKRERVAADVGYSEKGSNNQTETDCTAAKITRTPSKAIRITGMSENVGDRVCFSITSGREFRAIVKFEPIDYVTKACVECLRRYFFLLMF
jgi:hypothetical protein